MAAKLVTHAVGEVERACSRANKTACSAFAKHSRNVTRCPLIITAALSASLVAALTLYVYWDILTHARKITAPDLMKDYVVVMAISCGQLQRLRNTIVSLIDTGMYRGPIVIIFSEADCSEKTIYNSIGERYVSSCELKSFPKRIDAYTIPSYLGSHGPLGRGMTQETAWIYFLKFNVFDPFFLQWVRVLYVDAGIAFQAEVSHILHIQSEGPIFFAGSNCFPTYDWTLRYEFQEPPVNQPEHLAAYRELEQTYDIDVDYPQSTFFMFDTANVIDKDLVEELYGIQRRYPFCKHMDQGAVALFFTSIRPIWKPFPVYVGGKLKMRPWDYCSNRQLHGAIAEAKAIATKNNC